MNLFTNALKGMAMGIAEVIPGVSGGTIALITGIYSRLIDTITSFNLGLINSVMKEGLKGVKRYLDLGFVISLLAGMAMGLLFGIFVITYLYENFPEPLWGFFFGLILASSVYIGSSIKGWKIKEMVILLLGIAIAYGITIVSPASGNTSLWYVFLSGMLAITALILPGISGSFILLLLGMYTVIIPTLKGLITDFNTDGLIMISVFAVGCLTGLIGFSRILKYLFLHYERSTLVLLTGFMLGSLNKIWPWRNPRSLVSKDDGALLNAFEPKDVVDLNLDDYKILSEENVLPSEYWMSDPLLTTTIIAFLLGVGSIAIFSLIQKK